MISFFWEKRPDLIATEDECVDFTCSEVARVNRSFLTYVLGLACLGYCLSTSADGMPSIPSDYPSHSAVGGCKMTRVRQQLNSYNQERLALSVILRHLAEDPAVSAKARARLLEYAESLDTMRLHLPEPDPDSDAFRNFDFRLGMTLTSMLVFINTEDPVLAQRFAAERDNPHSELGLYIAGLDVRRNAYLDGLAAARKADCQT